MKLIYSCVATVFICFVICQSSFAATADTIKDEKCYGQDDEEGRCVPFSECLPYFKLLKERPILKAHLRLVVNLTCTFDLQNPLICCPLSEIHRPSNVLKLRQRPKYTPAVGDGNSQFPSFQNHRNFELLPSLNECSIQRENETIITGHKTVTNRGQFPWVVLLGYLNPLTGLTEFLCGGTVINRRYILTSAACTLKQGGLKPSVIRLSEHDLVNNPDCSNAEGRQMLKCSYAKDMKVESIIPHPQYDFTDLGFFQRNDIALIRTVHDILYNDFISPVCLPFVTDYKLSSYPEHLEDAQVSMAAGFGKFSNSEQGSHIMNMLPLSIKPNSKCAAFYSQQSEFTVDQICAGTGVQGQEACGPDTGGALMNFLNQKSSSSTINKKIIQVGVNSFGPQFCNHAIPQVYTKITSFLPWILDNIEP